MKRVLVLLAVAALAHADTQMQSQIEALTAIDTVPTTDELGRVFGDPVADLSGFALDTSRNAGVRLRAIHALVHYCTPSPPATICDQAPAHAPLVQIVNANAAAISGSDLLMLRAAIESLGPMQVATDLNLLYPLLNHPSRDVRATTALALGDLCNTNAISYLRTRLQNESVDQVRLAISTALRVLNQAPCSP
jgi:HEAT repeat protein